MTNAHSRPRKDTRDHLLLHRETIDGDTLFDNAIAENGDLFGEDPKTFHEAPTYEPLKCWWNAMINRDYFYAHQGVRLRIVLGSMTVDGHNLFASRVKTETDWADMIEETLSTGVAFKGHAWLEDEQGRVYDKFFACYERIALGYALDAGVRPRRGRPAFLKSAVLNEVYEGWTKEDLEQKRGVVYKEAPLNAQMTILSQLVSQELRESLNLPTVTSWIAGASEVKRVMKI